MAEVISVSALNKYVRSVLESDAVLPGLGIRGEISNFVRNSKSGHCYFSLVDAKAGVRVVMFRGDADTLAFRPENGMQVVIRGRVSLYERDGTFQIIAEYLFPDGVGAAQMAFEQLKQRLEAEGLFAPEQKKQLPEFPQCIGLVTSKTGAALQDILNVAQRRCPVARFLMAPVLVQGDAAAQGIADAIKQLDAAPEVDVIIVARGGGSAEDLWVFNAESVARAAFACSTPLVSAIGHEIDYTILDFVADLRAPTPSAAAEMVLPDTALIIDRMLHIYTNMSNIIQFQLDSCYNKLAALAQHPGMANMRARPGLAREKLKACSDGVQKLQQSRLDGIKTRSERIAGQLAALNPYAVLARGYSVAKQDGGTVRSVRQVQVGQPLELLLRDGTLDCVVEEIHCGEGGAGHGQNSKQP